MTAAGIRAGEWAGQRVLVLSPTPTHPQDFGNRKRIFRICSQLQSEGAEISFVHYPAEGEWRRANPWSAERAMAETWRQYFTIPPSRELHCSPKGAHHQIDEWWDPSIETFLRWLFTCQTFDVFIVNYAWLSKAFEFAPASVVKILDTHDKKSGRREVLTRHGIAPEYFYTTEAQEKIALNRCDIVWAIKDEERAHFERLSQTPVVTMPHLDPLRPLKRPAPDPDGYLRVGFLAARNNINCVNITNFLRVAEPIFNASFAPIRIMIAGSVCDLLEGTDRTFVELHGRVPDVDAFYQTVDCAIIPMTFSTGLKIKTAEAISAGLPVVSTAHAFEGFQPSDTLHTLPDFPAMALALVELAFAPRTQLDELRLASALTYTATEMQIAQSFERTLELVHKKQQSLVLAVDSRAFIRGTIFNLVLLSVHEYLRWLGNIRVLVVQGSAKHILADERLADELGRILIADDVEGAAECREALAAMHVETVNVEEYLAQEHVKVVVADAVHDAFHKPCCAETAIFARSEMIALASGSAGFAMPGEAFRRAFVVSPAYSREVAISQAAISGGIVLAPCFNRSNTLVHRLKYNGGLNHVVLLGSPQTRATVLALALAEAWHMKPLVVCGIDDVAGSTPAPFGGVSALDFVAELAAGTVPMPLFALDLSGGQPGLQVCREILERLNVPVITANTVGLHPTLGLGRTPGSVSTEFELSETFRSFALDPEARQNPIYASARTGLNSDRGWAYIWRFCKRLFETQDPEFA